MNKRDTESINGELRKYQQKWYEEIVSEWKEGGYKKDIKNYVKKKFNEDGFSFSEPFLTGLPEYDKEEAPLLMIVGQETNGWGDFKNFNSNRKLSEAVLNHRKLRYPCIKKK